MKKYITALLDRITVFLELFVALMLAVSVTLLALKMALSLQHIPNLSVYPNYDDLLETSFNLIIGVELIRMLYQHQPGTVFEVLLFALARQVIAEHANPGAALIGILAIAALFATRKFLFCEFDESEKIIFRATSRVRTVNRILHSEIPYEDNQTLGELIKKRFETEETEIGVGACTYFDDFGLRVAKMYNGDISRIEVIRAIK